MLAWAFAASARAAEQHEDREFARHKLQRMRYGVQWLLPQASVHWARVRGGSSGFVLPPVEYADA